MLRGGRPAADTVFSEDNMIFLTKLDGKQFMLNEQMIETVRETPDTVIDMNNGHSYIVRESMREIQQKIIENSRMRRRAALKAAKSGEPLT